jgi:hypothetical protein
MCEASHQGSNPYVCTICKKKSTWCVPFTRLTRPMVDMPSCTGLLKFFLKNVRGQFYPWAFHSVAWSFLTKIIDHMGFGPRWRIPVYNLLCVRSTCFRRLGIKEGSTKPQLDVIGQTLPCTQAGFPWSCLGLPISDKKSKK